MALSVKFRGDSSHLDRTLKKIGSDVGGFAKDAAGKIAQIGTAMVAAAAVGAAAFGGFKLAEFVKDSSAAAASMESLQMQFSTMLKSGEKARGLLSDMRKLGAQTPLEFKDIAEAGRSLLAFGEGADGLVATLRRIGDVSSGVGASIGDIAEIYGKARVAGTLFAEDINQLTGRGIPVIQEFAKQLGVGEDKVKKLGSEGKITFPMLEKAFIALTSSGGRFEGMMAQMANTTEGKISNMKDAWESLKVAFGEGMNEGVKKWVDNIGGGLSSAEEMVTLWGQNIGAVLAQAASGNADVLTKVGIAIGETLKGGIMAGLEGLGDLVVQQALDNGTGIVSTIYEKASGKKLSTAFGLEPRRADNIIETYLTKNPDVTNAWSDLDEALRDARYNMHDWATPGGKHHAIPGRDAPKTENDALILEIRKILEEMKKPKPMVSR